MKPGKDATGKSEYRFADFISMKINNSNKKATIFSSKERHIYWQK